MIQHVTEHGVYPTGQGTYGALCRCGKEFPGYVSTEDLVDALMEHAANEAYLHAEAAVGK